MEIDEIINGKNETPVVLIVEDDEGLNRLIQKSLKRGGYVTDHALSGKDAISKIKKKTDFLVLLDFMLTDMNGKHFIKTLNEMDCIAPFIIMTGFGDEKIAVEMMKLGARDYIIKDPNFIDLLPQKIKKVCDELENERKLALAEDALRKNEESLRSLMESASDFVVYQLIVNEKNLYLADVVFVSPSIRDIVGLKDPYKFDSWFEDIHEDDAKRVVKAMHKALSRGKPFDQMMRVFHNTKNEWRWIHSIANPVFDLNKKPTHFNGLIIDITERKEIEEELKKHRDHLEELVKERTAELESFSYSVSHDLRAPLRAIDGFSKIMAEKYLDKFDEEGKHILGMIRNNIKMMDQLINDLLALSHLNRKEINLNSVDIKQLVQSIFNELLPGNSRLDLKMQDNNIPLAYADGVMIKQVFVNLLSNAIKFTRYQNYPRIEVGGRINKNENVYFIKDNGVGFDMQYSEKLFHVFQRLHTQDEFEGTGVGLAIVKSIINRHGGRVWAEGKIDEGATFYFTLPKGIS